MLSQSFDSPTYTLTRFSEFRKQEKASMEIVATGSTRFDCAMAAYKGKIIFMSGGYSVMDDLCAGFHTQGRKISRTIEAFDAEKKTIW